MKNNLALYIHIPFCKSKCAYCSFVSFPAGKEVIDNYIENLIKEIELTSQKYKTKKVDTIFFGGGTPSYLSKGTVKKLMQTIKNNYNVTKTAEISLECNPESITAEKLNEYKEAGINRISIGFQTANDRLLKLINRPHTKKDFLKVIQLVKNAGFTNINADLILALPTQKLKDIKQAIKPLIKQSLTHISVYDLILEENSPLYNKVQNGEYKQLSEKLNLKMQNYVLKTLQKEGFNRYEVSSYAKAGYECKHNLKYWNLDDYLGLGLASHSKIGNTRFSNTENLEEYVNNLKQNKFDYKDLQTLTLKDQQEEFIMLGLRKSEGIDLNLYKKLFNENLIKAKQTQIEKFLIKGLVEFKEHNMYVTQKGMQVLNAIIIELI